MTTREQIPEMILAADPDILDDAIDEELLDAEDSVEEKLHYEITSYGADYDVHGLVRRLKAGDIKIPDFQRGYVWPIKQASRFIESLLLGLPVPGIFLSNEPETNKLLVIDGQQRLTTLRQFMDGIWLANKKEFALTDVQDSLLGKTYGTLEEEHRRVLENAIIHATVVKQTDPQDGGRGIYKIFERLNSSGMLLSPQEIRTAIYGGSLAKLLAKLNENMKWRKLFGPANKRMRDQELILRFLALWRLESEYTRPMKSFLNKFMNANRIPDEATCHAFEQGFINAIDLAYDVFGEKAFKPVKAFNAAVFDAVLTGLAKRIEFGPIDDRSALHAAYVNLMSDADFIAETSRSTANDESVKKRILKASSAFEHVP
jgi:hypothetical protein